MDKRVCIERKLILVRHGDIGTKYRKHFIGSTDLPLSQEGRKQAKGLRGFMANYSQNSAFFCSPMQRAQETAYLAGICSNQLKCLDDLSEVSFGDWEKHNYEQIQKDDPKGLRQWIVMNSEFCFPNGECISDFQTRVLRAANYIMDRKEGSLIIISHGGVIKTLICHFLGLPFENYILFQVDTGSVTAINLFGEKGVLSLLNAKAPFGGNLSG